MIGVRVHGRGGQGVVTTAELLAAAAFAEGHWAQAVPTFGSERTGAPVVSFCRIADRALRSHEPIEAPDVVLVQDPTLLHQIDVLGGLGPGGWVLVNTSRTFADLRVELPPSVPEDHRLTVPATVLAREHLGRPLPGAPLLGALAAATGIVSPVAVAAAIRGRFRGAAAAGNLRAADAAYDLVAAEREAIVHA